MAEEFEDVGGKSAGDLGVEALWFVAHSLLAFLVVVVVVAVFGLSQPDPDATQPKLLCTAIIFLAAIIVGFGLSKVIRNEVARHIWISGLLMFSIVCVYVLDLPTGPGLCNGCGAVEKLYRTFFNLANPSGLMGGYGFAVGTWLPLSLVSYSLGANLGLPKTED
ncbi:hypothetical protein [Terriglobus tenax]|uniref:hypothetical protein n=1 Tax=Terriglobus tenax TaxID=1111115 RepID=UPI0021E07A01|nr:hypothetical protein [Terriglobus tenax]